MAAPAGPVQGTVEISTPKTNGFRINDVWYNIPAGGALPPKNSIVSFVNTVFSDGKTYADQLQVTGQAAPAASARRGGYGGGNKTPHDKFGPIIGHNLLVAATILGERGVDVPALITLAKEITIASEQLVNSYVASKAGDGTPSPVAPVAPAAPAAPAINQAAVTPAAPPTPQAAPPAPGFDDDIPW